MVSEAIFPTYQGYVCIQKWSQIFVLGTGMTRTKSEKRVNLVSENDLFHTLGSGTSSAQKENHVPATSDLKFQPIDAPLVPKGTQQIPTRSTFIRILDQEGSNELNSYLFHRH